MYSSVFSVIFPLLLFVIFLVKWLYTSSSSSSSSLHPKKKKLPPSPLKLPIIGNLHQLFLSSSHPHRSLQSLSQKHGRDLMLLHFGTKPVLIVSSAKAAKEIMKTHDLIFSSRPKLTIPSKLFYNGKDVAFSPYGEHWRHARSVCVIHLLNNKMVRSFRHVREEETSEMIEKIREKQSRLNINLSDVFVTLTNDVICRVALGKKYGEEEESGRRAKAVLSEFVELLGTFCVGDYLPWIGWLVNRFNGLDAKIERVNKGLDELIETAIEEHVNIRMEDVVNPDFVDVLLDLQMKNDDSSSGGFTVERDTIKALILMKNNDSSSVGFTVERHTIKALILDMFSAGTDTAYSVLEWTMTELLRHPKIMKKLQKEVGEVAQGKEQVTEDDIGKMHYLKAVIKETLRLHFPAPLLVPRESTQDVKVMGYDVLAGTQVIVNGWAIAKDPMSWENPEEFRPERFSDSSRDVDFRGLNFEFLPFGAGQRICLGINFGLAVIELALAKLMYKFNFALPDEEKGMMDNHIPESSGLTIHRKFPLLVQTTPCSI